MTYFKCLDHQFGLEYFALKSTNTTDAITRQSIPQFYKQCILNFQELNRTARLCKNDGSDIIWGNSKILFNEKPLMFSHWARSGIIHISDIINNGILLENNIYNSLQNKAVFIFEIQTIKSCLSDGCFTISQSNENFPQKMIPYWKLCSDYQMGNSKHSMNYHQKICMTYYCWMKRCKSHQSCTGRTNLMGLILSGRHGSWWILSTKRYPGIAKILTGKFFMVKWTVKVDCRGCHYQMEYVNYVIHMWKTWLICCMDVKVYVTYGLKLKVLLMLFGVVQV